MASLGELHAENKANWGQLPCGCSKYYVDVMGCDHDCDHMEPQMHGPWQELGPFVPSEDNPF